MSFVLLLVMVVSSVYYLAGVINKSDLPFYAKEFFGDTVVDRELINFEKHPECADKFSLSYSESVKDRYEYYCSIRGKSKWCLATHLFLLMSSIFITTIVYLSR